MKKHEKSLKIFANQAENAGFSSEARASEAAPAPAGARGSPDGDGSDRKRGGSEGKEAEGAGEAAADVGAPKQP